MYVTEIDEQVCKELFEERKEFARKFVKDRWLEIERLESQIDELKSKLTLAEEEYDSYMEMTVDDLYDKYRFQTGGFWYSRDCTVSFSSFFPRSDAWQKLED